MSGIPMVGFVDISIAMRPGVFVLWRGDRAVYVAWARIPLAAIEAHRGFTETMATSFAMLNGPRRFDRIEVFPCASDRARALVASLREFHSLVDRPPAPVSPPGVPRLSLKPQSPAPP